MENIMVFYRDIYAYIASYLTHFDVIKSLDLVERDSHGLVDEKDIKLAKKVLEFIGIEYRYEESCRLGYLDGIHRYHRKEHAQDGFTIACKDGQLDAAKLIHKLGGVDIHYKSNLAFKATYMYGHLEVGKWLYGLGGINISQYQSYAMLECCTRGDLEYAQWMYSLATFDIHYDDDKLFLDACVRGYLDIAQWLYSLGANIHAHGNILFTYKFSYKNLNIWEWLQSLD